MENETYLMGVCDFAKKVGLSSWTIRRYVADGRIAAAKIGTRILIESTEADRLFAEGRSAIQAEIAKRTPDAAAAVH